MSKSINKKNNKQWFGVMLIIIGLLFLANTFELPMPDWFFSWPMLIIGIGLYSGIASKFKDWSWLVMIAIGFVFIIDDITGRDIKAFSLLIPAVMIYYGIRFVTKSSKKIHVYDEVTGEVTEHTSDGDRLSLVAAFAGNKKIIVSKNFKGGEIVSVFGGNEINLINADFEGTIKLEIVSVLGGTKLIVPANWQIKTEMISVFGGFDDKRNQINLTTSDKILIIEGVNIFSGIDIRSY
jgi:predicted membrane protein